MTLSDSYKAQAECLLDVLPFIQDEPRFALKGGTAINLFHRNMPRLSVDIDLTWLPVEPRDIFLNNLSQAMQKLADRVSADGFDVKIRNTGQHIIKLLISNQQTMIKVEPNTILRGTVYEPETRELTDEAQNVFLQTQKVKMVSVADLYAGKICAALDRQHPRDLFDIKLLFENEGLTPAIRQAFVVYLAGGPRPMSELLAPNELDMQDTFNKEFTGMTANTISYSELCEIRSQLISLIQGALLPNERDFLISIKAGEPNWELMPFPHLATLPGIKWKILNVQKMSGNDRNKALNKLKDILY